MSLASGSHLGPYEILGPIGAGGMGEVYRARDSRLSRDVAIKVLPHALSADPERRDRFVREARAVSSLNHPNICTVHDVGSQDGIDFLVMELLEGESLAARLAKGAMPLDAALRAAIEIADALARAHRQGIVHRDLKPDNVFLTRQGAGSASSPQAKLLDFGLAKIGVATPASGITMMPTVEKTLTAEGTILGTFQYMAPEQLEGQEADTRTDVFAFGAVLYEMVTGRKAFEGRSQASLIAAIINANPPPLAAAEPMTPPALERLVRVCLNKDPEDRWQTMHDVAMQLRWIAEGGSQLGVPAPVVARRRTREHLAWALAALLGIGVVALGARAILHTEPAPTPVRFSVVSPPGVTLSFPKLSPDGRTIAFVGTSVARNRQTIWIRPLDSTALRELEGTEGALRPFWSPDSRFLGFFVNSQLKKIAVSGGPPQLIATQPGGADGTWSPQGVILFDGRGTDPIWRVPASGGSVTVAMKPDPSRNEIGVGWPYFLPDGRHFIFTANDQSGPSALRVGSLDEEGSTVLGGLQSRVEYSSGHLVYATQNTLMARPFSASSRTFTGDPFPVTDRMELGNLGLVDFSLSQTGDLAFITRASAPRSRLVWINRAGQEVGTVAEPAVFGDLALSPDASRVAAAVTTGSGGQRTTNIWVYDVKRGAASRLTFEGQQTAPVWSPDGSRIAFANLTATGMYEIGAKLASGAGAQETLASDKDRHLIPSDWSQAGSRIAIITSPRSVGNVDVAVLETSPQTRIVPFAQAPPPVFEVMGAFSPDGKLIAYQSNESQRMEVYVQPYPPTGARWLVSTAGGIAPMWRGDGREIYFSGPDDSIYAVPVDIKGGALEAGMPVKLFQRTVVRATPQSHRWVAARDGQRFLLNVPAETGVPPSAEIVLNWASTLKR